VTHNQTKFQSSTTEKSVFAIAFCMVILHHGVPRVIHRFSDRIAEIRRCERCTTLN
jgi:hypothetical protein